MTPTAKTELEHLAALAKRHGRVQIEAICVLALATLNSLEAELLQIVTRRQQAGVARAAHLTPQRRHDIASHAAKQRWLRRRAS
jgi:hypothetical protein